jgi:hypothetical protein
MSLKDEAFTGDLADYLPADEQAEEAIAEADTVEATEQQEVTTTEPDATLDVQPAETASSTETPGELLTRDERLLRRYQEEAKARIPKLIGDILSRPYEPWANRKSRLDRESRRAKDDSGGTHRRGL